MEIVDSICEPGNPDKNNEDTWGHTKCAVWVFDGATGLADDTLVAPPGKTDPRWLVEQADHSLKNHADKIADMHQLYRTILFENAQIFHEQARRPVQQSYEMPMAASMVVKYFGGRAICGHLSDCALIIETTTGLQSLTGDEHHAALDAQTYALMKEDIAKGTPLSQARAKIVPQLKRARMQANRPGGYDVYAPDPDLADKVKIDTFSPAPDGYALLMSDGFYRLVDVMKKYNEADLIAAAKTQGLESLYNELRAAENADPDARTHLRAKKSDDATAVLLRFD